MRNSHSLPSVALAWTGLVLLGACNDVTGPVTAVATTIANNRAGLDGGGLYGDITLTNCTVSANAAGRKGGAAVWRRADARDLFSHSGALQCLG